MPACPTCGSPGARRHSSGSGVRTYECDDCGRLFDKKVPLTPSQRATRRLGMQIAFQGRLTLPEERS
jgi:transposase-like protein